MAGKAGRVLRTGLYRRKCSDGAAKQRIRPSINDPSRKQAKQSKQQVKAASVLWCLFPGIAPS